MSSRGLKSNVPSPVYLADLNSLIWTGDALETYSPGADSVAGNHQPFDPSPASPPTQIDSAAALVRAYEDYYDAPLVIFKYAIGGMPLLAASSAVQGSFDPQENELFRIVRREFKQMVKALYAQYSLPVKVVLSGWCQGESDEIYAGANPGEYKVGFERLLAGVRDLANDDSLPMYIMPPCSYDFTAYDGADNTVRYEQIEVALSDPNVMVTTCNFGEFYGGLDVNNFTVDGVHFTSEVQIKEGTLAFQRFKNLRASQALPSPPTNLAGTPTSTTIALTWDDVSSREYIVAINDTVVGTTSGTSLTVPGLNPSTSHSVKVYAHNDAFNVSHAEITVATTS